MKYLKSCLSLTAFAALLLVTSLVPGCGSTAESNAAEDEGLIVVRRDEAGDPKSMDPHKAGDVVSSRTGTVLAYLAHSGGTYYAAGDCNAELRAPSMHLLQAPAAETRNPELADRALFALEEAVPADRRFTVDHGGDRVMLDHLLVSRALRDRFASIEIQNEALRDETAPEARSGSLPDSFHAPLVAAFDLPG